MAGKLVSAQVRQERDDIIVRMRLEGYTIPVIAGYIGIPIYNVTARVQLLVKVGKFPKVKSGRPKSKEIVRQTMPGCINKGG